MLISSVRTTQQVVGAGAVCSRVSPVLLLSLTLFVGCSTTSPVDTQLAPRSAASAPTLPPVTSSARNTAGAMVDAVTATSRLNAGSLNVTKAGTGVLLKPAPETSIRADQGAPVSLSFENGDIREIVKNLLGDLLGLNYIIDPRVQGTITIRTAQPIPRSGVIPLLETVLRGSNASLVQDGAYWRVLPSAEAVRGYAKPVLADEALQARIVRGTAVVVYPVKFVGAKELMRVIEPFARDPANTLRIDELRNFLYISAPQVETDRLLEIVAMFDVNLLEGMSFALVTLQSSDVKTAVADLDKVLGANNPFAGLLRIVPLERMNAILLISAQRSVIDEARIWVERLDAGGADAGDGQKLFVYQLKYTQAEKLQAVLQMAVSGRVNPGGVTPPPAAVAPGQRPATLNSPVSPMAGQSTVQPGNTAINPSPVRANIAGNSAGNAIARNATIVPDKDRNALLIVATQTEYNAIESVIRKLDMPPKQVAIEVQIAEVTLTGEFSFGLDSYFQGKLGGSQNRMTSEDGVGSLAAGLFTYTWKKTDAIKAILTLNEAKSRIRTISQPTLITLENQKATFSAGTQISVRTQSSANTTTGSTDSYQYINTGIDLNVTPRVSGKNVFLDITQDISDAGVATAGNPNPPITRRSASTSVMVTSGDTMLMGGLYQDGGRSASSGLPVLSGIPFIGGAFGSQSWNNNRTELVLLITPRVLSDETETRDAVDELRKRMGAIEELAASASTKALPTTREDKLKLQEQMRLLGGSLKLEALSSPGKTAVSQ